MPVNFRSTVRKGCINATQSKRTRHSLFASGNNRLVSLHDCVVMLETNHWVQKRRREFCVLTRALHFRSLCPCPTLPRRWRWQHRDRPVKCWDKAQGELDDEKDNEIDNSNNIMIRVPKITNEFTTTPPWCALEALKLHSCEAHLFFHRKQGTTTQLSNLWLMTFK